MDPRTAEVMGKWFDACHRAGISLVAASAMGEVLVGAYGDEHRSYHTLEHVQACLSLVEHAPLDDHDRLTAEFALWFHDVVYDTARTDNEERSALMAEEWLQEQQFEAWALAGAAIRMTAGHATRDDDPLLLRVVRDIDLAILGAQSDEYDSYAANIRSEYRSVDDDSFREGRRRVLESFLAMDRIYVLEPMRASLESRARANLERELASLQR